MLRFLLLAASCAASYGKVSHITWTDCSSASSFGKITNVTVTPNPPVLGKNTTLRGTGTLTKEITDGQLSIKSTYSGLPIPINPSVVPICGSTTVKLPLNLGQITLSGFDCPKAAGILTLTETVLIPEIAPLGTYTAQLSGINQDGDETACILVTIVVTQR